MSADGGLVITSARSGAHIERGILQLLLSRKRLILRRIESISADEKIESIQDLINRVSDEEVKSKLEEEVVNLRDVARDFREQEIEVEQEQTKEEIKNKADELLRVELFERRSKVWFTLLERESAATILGGILLFIILITHVTAIFSKFPVPEILNNAFLIILATGCGFSSRANLSESLDILTIPTIKSQIP